MSKKQIHCLIWALFAVLVLAIVFLASPPSRRVAQAAPEITPIASQPAPQTLLSPPPTLGTTSAVVTSVSAPVGLPAIVPPTKAAFEQLKDGTVRVQFQFKPEHAAAAKSLAEERGAPLWLQVTRGTK